VIVLKKPLNGEGNTGAAGKKSTAHYSAYEIEAVRHRDHAMISISNGKQTVQSVVAFPDSTRFAYLSLTGEHCTISSIHVDEDAGVVPEDYIPRIAEEISYIKGCPQGDIFGDSLAGHTPFQIAKALTAEGIPTPAGKTQWSYTTVRRVLSKLRVVDLIQ
jgi:hypothetical protein